MNIVEHDTVFDREEAGILLSTKLQGYRGTAALIVGIPRGGVVVASKVSELLSLPLEILPCRKIKDPADQTKSIGSVSLDEVAIEHSRHDLPQDYISHQIALIRNGLRREWQSYYLEREPISFCYKAVIVIDDIIKSGDTMIACLKSILKQNPLRVIVAVPFLSAEAARKIARIVNEIVFIQMKSEAGFRDIVYVKRPASDQSDVKGLLPHLQQEVGV